MDSRGQNFYSPINQKIVKNTSQAKMWLKFFQWILSYLYFVAWWYTELILYQIMRKVNQDVGQHVTFTIFCSHCFWEPLNQRVAEEFGCGAVAATIKLNMSVRARGAMIWHAFSSTDLQGWPITSFDEKSLVINWKINFGPYLQSPQTMTRPA